MDSSKPFWSLARDLCCRWSPELTQSVLNNEIEQIRLKIERWMHENAPAVYASVGELDKLERRVKQLEMMAHLHEEELALDEIENTNNPPVRLEQFVKLQETVATFNIAVLEHGRRLDMIKDSVLEHDERLRKIETRRTSSLIRHQEFDETGKAIYDRYVCPRCGGSFDASSSMFESESVCPFCGPLVKPPLRGQPPKCGACGQALHFSKTVNQWFCSTCGPDPQVCPECGPGPKGA